jgi:hypothetical protein
MILVGKCKLCDGERLIGGMDKLCDNCWEMQTRITNNPKGAIKVLNELGYTVTKKGGEHERADKQTTEVCSVSSGESKIG